MSSRVLLFAAILLLTIQTALANEPAYFRLPSEPLIRIGLSTNASSVSIATSDAQLVAYLRDYFHEGLPRGAAAQ